MTFTQSPLQKETKALSLFMQNGDETYKVVENVSLMLGGKFTPQQHISQRHRQIRNPCERESF
jgi:hypothetical protein